MLDYKLVEAMAAVFNEGGFDKAARALHLTQSAVSQRVKLLEEQVGQVLLVRAAPPRVTPAGRRLLGHYLKVKKLEDDLAGNFSSVAEGRFVSLSIGINADSLATWFPEAVESLIRSEKVVFDIRTDDQEQTHRMLKNGEVAGCVSVRDTPMQGCRTAYLGKMNYRMFGAPDFVKKWFPEGLTARRVLQAPALIFNRKDDLHNKLFTLALGKVPARTPTHYMPSSEKFAYFIASGFGYGMLPEQQSLSLEENGQIIDLAPGCRVAVKLYWHCWNLESRLLKKLSRALVKTAGRILAQ